MKKRINFYEKEATEYGVSEAIFLNYIREQVLLSKKKKENLVNGHHWFVATHEAISNEMPFWTERQIRYIVKKLIDQKVIKTIKKNNQNFNQTIWYRIN